MVLLQDPASLQHSAALMKHRPSEKWARLFFGSSPVLDEMLPSDKIPAMLKMNTSPLFPGSSSALQQPTAYRPRLLLAGAPGSGQSSHLAPALLHHLDKLPVHRLDLPTLYSVSAKTPEESCAQVSAHRGDEKA